MLPPFPGDLEPRARARWGRGSRDALPPGAGLPGSKRQSCDPGPGPAQLLAALLGDCPRLPPDVHTRGASVWKATERVPSETYGNEVFGRCRLGTRPTTALSLCVTSAGTARLPGKKRPGSHSPRGGADAELGVRANTPAFSLLERTLLIRKILKHTPSTEKCVIHAPALGPPPGCNNLCTFVTILFCLSPPYPHIFFFLSYIWSIF